MPSRYVADNFRWHRDGELQHIVVENGRVTSREPGRFEGQANKVQDLQGRTLLPALIDAHCHFLPTGLDLLKLNLGGCDSPDAILDAVRDRHRNQPDGWLLAVHYDQNRWGGPHLTKEDLDQISADRPISLRHVNGHASVVNSAALEAAGIADDAIDPEGGSFGRHADGSLSGVLFEAAHERVTSSAPKPTLDEMVEGILRAGRSMAELGLSCASDLMTGVFDLETELEAYRRAARAGNPVRVRLYLQWRSVFGKRAVPSELIDGFRSDRFSADPVIAGVKIFADGAIGSATAAIYGRYSGAPANGPRLSGKRADAAGSTDLEVNGQLMYSTERLNEMVETANDAGYQIAIHSIGDYSTDLVMDAFEGRDSARHRIEHAMILSDPQIARLAALGTTVTMQPEFLKRFGHAYLAQLGPERTSRLKRMRSVTDAGIPLALSSDRPIVGGDPRDGISIATSRPEGFDPRENISLTEAIEGYTSQAADANGDRGVLGRLAPGELFEALVLDDAPKGELAGAERLSLPC